jgi:hypothetical protein
MSSERAPLERLVLLAAGVVEGVDHAIADAAGGEGRERAAVRSPCEDRRENRDARLLSDVFAFDGTRQVHAAKRRLDQRFVAAQQFFSGALVAALCGRPQPALVQRGNAVPSNGGGHARAG